MATSSGGTGDDPMDLSALFGGDDEEVGFFGLPDLPETGPGSGGFPLPPEPDESPDPGGRVLHGGDVDIAPPDVATAGIDPTAGSVTAGLPLTAPVDAPRAGRVPSRAEATSTPAGPAAGSMLRSNLSLIHI